MLGFASACESFPAAGTRFGDGDLGVWGGEQSSAPSPAHLHPTARGPIQHLLPGERRPAKEAQPVCSSWSGGSLLLASPREGYPASSAALHLPFASPGFPRLSRVRGMEPCPGPLALCGRRSGGRRGFGSVVQLLGLSLRVTKLLSVKK